MGKWLRGLSWGLSFTVIFNALALGVTACGGGGGGGSAASGQPSISSFTAGSTIITEGASVSLTAVFSNGTGVIDNGVGSVSSGTPVSVTPSTTTTYTLTVANTSGEVVTSTVTVTVVPPPSITSFTSDASVITAGSTVTLTAVFSNGTGVIDNGAGSVTSGTPVTVAPGVPTTYTLTVTNAAGTSVTSSVAVNVVGLDALSTTAAATDQTFQPGQADYTATVGFLARDIRVKATSATPGATITVNGVTLGADNTSQLITLSEGVNPVITIVVSASSLSKTYTLTPTRRTAAEFAQQAYVKASNTGGGDAFGTSVAVAGDTMAVGAYTEDSASTGVNGYEGDDSASNSGAVYVFTRNGTTWTQQAYIKASNTDREDYFGFSVALSEDGNTLAVGAHQEDSDPTAPGPGAVYVFTRSGTTWTQEAHIKPSTGSYSYFGYSVALSGDTLAAGARATGGGSAYIFIRSGSTWTQQAYLKGSNTESFDNFGISIALSGDTLAVGAYAEDSIATGINGNGADNSATDSGAAYVFTRSGTTWTQQAYIKASNTGTGDSFGYSVALLGDTLAVGAISEDSNATGINGNEGNDSAASAGAVYVFTRSGTTWTQQAYIKASNTEANDLFGSSVSLAKDTLAVGAIGEDSNATGINGNEADNTAASAGAAYVFTRNGTTWSQLYYIKPSNMETLDAFGYSVSLSEDTLAVGADNEDSNATGVNGDQADNSALDAGAVYVFE